MLDRHISHRIRIADKIDVPYTMAVYMCYNAFHINYDGPERLERVNSASYTTRTRKKKKKKTLRSHDAYTYMHIRAAGYSVKNGTTGAASCREGGTKERSRVIFDKRNI